MAIEAEYGVRMDDDVIGECKTVADWQLLTERLVSDKAM
jgi:acyl carrier protein